MSYVNEAPDYKMIDSWKELNTKKISSPIHSTFDLGCFPDSTLVKCMVNIGKPDFQYRKTFGF